MVKQHQPVEHVPDHLNRAIGQLANRIEFTTLDRWAFRRLPALDRAVGLSIA